MDAMPLVLDGYLDTVAVPGDTDGTTARFRLTVSPTEDVADEAMLPCTTGDPRVAHAVLTEIQPGDLLRVSGTLSVPGSSDGIICLHVDALEVLSGSPMRGEMVLDRYGPYLVVFDADIETVPVFTATGTWVGTAKDPDLISDVVEAFERDTATGETGSAP